MRRFETMLSYTRGATTETGLKVKPYLLDGHYDKGMKVSDEQMKALELERHEVCPNWNYIIKPRSMAYTPA